MEEKLVIFACEDLIIKSGEIKTNYINIICLMNKWKVVDIMEFCGFVYVEVK